MFSSIKARIALYVVNRNQEAVNSMIDQAINGYTTIYGEAVKIHVKALVTQMAANPEPYVALASVFERHKDTIMEDLITALETPEMDVERDKTLSDFHDSMQGVKAIFTTLKIQAKAHTGEQS